MVRVASVAVPRARRGEWLQVWAGELWHSLLADAEDDRIEVGRGASVLLRAAGAFPHALHELRVEGSMGGWVEDVRFGVRVLLRRKGWTALAAATLSVAAGATTAMFAVVDGVLLRPLPFREPDQLVALRATWEGEHGEVTRDRVSLPAFDQFRASQNVVDPLAAYSSAGLVVDLGEGAELVEGAYVSAGFFETLGIAAVLGRTFAANEDEPGTPLVAVVSRRFWQHRLGGAPDVTTRSIRVRGNAVPIVGVVPDAATLPSPTTDVWLPTSTFPRSAGFHSHRLVGRLREGLSLDAAQPGLAAAAGEIPEAPGVMGELHLRGDPLAYVLVGSSRPALLALSAATLVILAIAAVNLGNLYGVRTGERSGELAVRAALGASSTRLRRQLALEAIILAGISLVPALILGDALVQATLVLAADTLPRSWDVHVDPRVALFALAVAGTTAILAAATTARPGNDVGSTLRDAAARAAGGLRGRRVRSGLVIFQVGAAGLLLIAAGLLLRSYEGLTSKDPGLDPTTLAVVPSLSGQYADKAVRDAFLLDLTDRLSGLPGVSAASFADAAPLGGHSNIPVEVEDVPTRDPNQEADRVLVGPGYFESLGAVLLQGRSLGASDRADAVQVAVVNETFAHTFLPGGALGHRIRQGPDDPEWRTIVGVVADIRQQGTFVDVAPHVYLPILQLPEPGPVALLVRPEPGARPLHDAVRRTLRQVDPSIALSSMETVRARFSRELATPRLHLALMGVFATTALTLALVGVFGVVSQRVRRRRREMAIRLTLGAEGGALVRGVVATGASLGLAGVTLGLLAAVATSKISGRFLFDVSPLDPPTLAAIALLLMATTTLASWLPARGASRVNPGESLRGD